MSDDRTAYCVLLWGRDVRLYDSLDEAITSAMWTMNSDNDWIDRIEIIGEPDEPSRVIKGRELYRLVGEREDRWNAAQPPRPPHVANVYIDDLPLESFYGDDGLEKATALLERLRPRLGERVTLRPIINGRHADV